MIRHLILFLALVASGGVGAAPPAGPVISDFGITHTPPNAAERPDPTLRYRVVFNVTRAAAAPGDINPSLNRAARLINLLAEDGVRIAPGDIVAIVHGEATPAIMTDASYAKRTLARSNPNLALIRRLKEAGVRVSVCSQALHSQMVALDDVDPLVVVDVSALVTLANFQLRGYALIPD
jgi:intracellular sulfur oxidation DsrE/DsrF family protein